MGKAWHSLFSYSNGQRSKRQPMSSYHMIFRQNQKLPARQSKFIAEDFDIVFADQRCPPGDPPGRTVIDRRLAWVGEAATELRVFHLLPETAIVQMGIVE